MAGPTLAQFQTRERPTLFSGIIDSIVTRSQILQFLPWVPVEGLEAKWNELNSYGGAGWSSPVGGSKPSGSDTAATTAAKDASVTMLTADIQLGHGVARSRREFMTQMVGKSTGISNEFSKQFTEGNGQNNVLDGLGNIVSTSTPDQQLDGGANGSTLTLDILDELIDLVKGGTNAGTASILLMHSTHSRKVRSLLRAAGVEGTADTMMLANPVNPASPFLVYNGATIMISDHIGDVTRGTGTTKPIYALRLDSGMGMDGVAGIYQTGGMPVEVLDGGIDPANTFHFWRIVMLAGIAVFDTQALAQYRYLLLT